MPTEFTFFGDLDVGGKTVTLDAETSADGTILSAALAGGVSFTIGDVLGGIYSLAIPGGQLTLEPPWDALANIEVDVSKLSFELDVTNRRIGFSVSFTADAGAPGQAQSSVSIGAPGFLTINELEVFLSRDSTTNRNRVDLTILGSFLGLDFSQEPGLTWDLLRDPPPTAPGTGPAILDLRYIGLGQHITLDPPPTTMAEVVQELENQAPPSPGTTPPFGLNFEAAAGWLAALDLTVLGTVSLSAIFNDPTLYGLRVSLQGARAKSLAGLEFEILYHKIDNTLGVYHTELKLPDAIRHMDIGEAAVTLPIIDIDVYTDGSFLIDFGFPWNLDFSRSMTVDIIVLGIPVQAAMGFHFGVLDGHAASAFVPVISNGVFSPVIVLGVGAQIGIGKNFQEGPLTAGFLIAIEGLIEGVLAFFHPNDPSAPTATFFKVTGMVSVIGHLFGSVDLGLISARVDVLVQVTAHVNFQIYQQVIVVLNASVDISLTVEVAGLFTIDLEFHASITEQVAFGSDQQTPWIES